MSERRRTRPPRLARTFLALALGALTAVAAIVASAGSVSATPSSATVAAAGSLHASAAGVQLQALTAAANPKVGPLFTGDLSSGHSCTASVLSVGRGLLLTAAHCLSGSPQGIKFVPGYDGTKSQAAPYGIWTVSRAWIPAGWVAGQNDEDDYAILQVGDNIVGGRSTSVTDVVGGNGIGIASSAGVAVTVPAYVDGADDAPISCTAALTIDHGFPSFGCAGYLSGTSGAPWIEVSGNSSPPAVVGVIGGLHQGGCSDSTSYSPDFDSDVYLLMIRAVVGLPSDTAPTPPADGC